MGAASCGLGILVWLFHLTTDENYCMEMAKNYMVDYLENVCLRKYEKMNQKERTVRVNIENGPAEEEIQKDKIQKDEIQKRMRYKGMKYRRRKPEQKRHLPRYRITV